MSLKNQADYLITEHPDLASQIQAGLLLAIAGRVKAIGDPDAGLIRQWEVLGESYEGSQCKVYTVRDLDTTPRRWSCNCEQGATYGPLTADFLGHPGRICKHIAAVGILWLECDYPEKATTLWELVTRLVSEQGIYLAPNQYIELPHPRKVKLEYSISNGRDGLVLKMGTHRSETLAVLGQPGGEGWRLVGEAEARYQEFVSKINGGSK